MAKAASAAAMSSVIEESWDDWRKGVVAVIQDEFRDVLFEVGEQDVDWDAWRPLYEQGRSPRAAVNHAFLRDL